MRTTLLIALLLSVVIVLITGCKSDDSVTSPSQAENLLVNTSFESHSGPSLEGWTANTTDTSFVHFSFDAPVGGGMYSVWLLNYWPSPGSILYPISPPTGTHRYQLSAWGKAVRTNPLPPSGVMAIVLRRAGVDSLRKSYVFTDSTWTIASLLDTVTTNVSDTLLVRLHGGSGPLSSGYTLFDLCNLVKLD